jgi:hypothetical protein
MNGPHILVPSAPHAIARAGRRPSAARLGVLLAAAFLAGGVLSGCASTPGDGNVITPVVQSADDLQGATVDLKVGQVLDITTGDLAVDSYTGKVEDTSVAEFTAGRDDGSAQFNPGVKGLAPGTTQVVLSNSDGGIQDVTFEVTVSE